MNADDVNPPNKAEIDYLNDPVFNAMQWWVRASFEEGYRSANQLAKPKEWLSGWMTSRARKFLIDNGLMTGNEGYK